MNTESTVEQMQHLKLFGMSKLYKAVLDQPSHEQPEAHTLLGMLTDAETQYRLSQRTQLYLRLSKLRYSTLPEQVNTTSGRGITRDQLLLFCDGSFIEKGENVLVTGLTGCGKSYLACALGRQACMLGYRTLYFAMNRFIEALAASKLDGTYIRWLNQIARTPLLILDDFGLQPLDHHTKLALLQILEDRYAKSATIITSQIPVKAWYEYINEPTLADAIMDRMTANANRIELKGESLRTRKNS
jgi:DNA replication protein DnaC